MKNPNRRFKSLWEETYYDEPSTHPSMFNRPEDGHTRQQLAPELVSKPIYVRCLLLIPKNLVYVFILVICFAFGAMSYITYTE